MALIKGLQTTWKILWRILLFYLAWAVLLAFLFVPFGSKVGAWYKTNPVETRLYGDIVTIVTMLTATWLALKFIDRRAFKTIGFASGNIIKDLFTGVVIGSVWLCASLGIAWIFGWAVPVYPAGFSWNILLISAVSMLLNVAAQELLLCGFIFQTIRNRSNVTIAIIISAALFAGYHLGAFKGEWLPAVNVFAAGVFFCIAYLITNNLWLPVAIHFSWDVLLGPVFGITESGRSNLGGGWKMFTVNGPKLLTGGPFGMEGGLIVTITTAITIIFILIFYRQKIEKLL
ncbi:MAG: type II CAAX endopeptidase family protein [Ignavibacteriaceae bacterium]|nr:type II CAAX endopeptidase family protein [Ignavibacteriaceae bacterium]